MPVKWIAMGLALGWMGGSALAAGKRFDSPPPMRIDPSKDYAATIKTSRGEIRLDLYERHAPKTVNNFVCLSRERFYDGLTFHRVIPDFMIQGGDPDGNGSGGPGYTFEDEVEGNPNKHQDGTLSMANSGPDTNGSQFFITHVKTDWLDGKHTVFGRVQDGDSQKVVNSIRKGDIIESILIRESPRP